MLNLMLMRHAKAASPAPGQEDADRPLTGRGKRAAAAMGNYLGENELVPDLVLCSPARRAKETWKFVARKLAASPRTLFERDLYDFGDGEALLKCLQRHAGKAKSILLISHNPSIEGLAQRLARKGDKKLRSLLQAKYPTGALTVIALDYPNWAALAEGAGTLSRFVRPKDIMAE